MDCCRDFSEAQECCTDNEGYSQAIKLDRGDYYIGLIRNKIIFCPWCGKKLEEEMSNRVEQPNV